MKTVFFLLWNTKNYGCNKMALGYARGLLERGYRVKVFSFGGGKKDRIVGIKIHSYFKLLLFPASPDVLIFTGFWPIAFLALPLRAKEKLYFIQALDSEIEKNSFLRFLAQLSYYLPFRKIVISKYLQSQIKKISGQKAKLLPYYLESKYLSVKKKRPERSSPKMRVLSVLTSYHFVKGPDLLEKIIKQLKKDRPDLFFVLISFMNYPYSSSFDEFISNPPLKELITQYQRADLFLNASRTEGFFLPGLEAMACGTPVLMTDSGGVREYAHNNKNCLLVKNAQKIFEKKLISKALSDNDLRNKLTDNGLKTARLFTFRRAIDKLEEML